MKQFLKCVGIGIFAAGFVVLMVNALMAMLSAAADVCSCCP